MNFFSIRNFWFSLILIIAFIVLVILIFFSSLDGMTNHGEVVKVPNVTRAGIGEATELLEKFEFEVEIQDSVFVDSVPGLTVIRQTPEPDVEVKKGRTVYLTITRAIAPLVDMPDLRGFSFLSAEHNLRSMGLKLGDTIQKPDIAKNTVMDQLYKGVPIKPGTKLDMGSTINLVVGSGVGITSVPVPDLVGLTFAEAKAKLEEMNINLGATNKDPDAADKDINTLYVREQSPQAISEPIPGQKVINKIRPGQLIDLTLSVSQPPPRPVEPPPVEVSKDPPSIGN